ncbi:hypothetical protein [Stieleria magnilauensis]
MPIDQVSTLIELGTFLEKQAESARCGRPQRHFAFRHVSPSQNPPATDD